MKETNQIPASDSAVKKPERSPAPRIVIAAAAWVLLVLLDQWTKIAMTAALAGNAPIILIPGVLEFLYVENTGAAFSMLENAQWFFLIVATAAILGIGWLLYKMPKTEPESRRLLPMRICLLLISAGAMGNLIDRIRFSYVRDFIYFSLIDFPVFNVADIYVTTATAVMILLVLFVYKDEDFAFLSSKKDRSGDSDR
ncbi:MAG: signal peptidase II [Lachnospiraceae bacterium]|nr:signal peptidase II [Lachnospiraceae bacterium]